MSITFIGFYRMHETGEEFTAAIVANTRDEAEHASHLKYPKSTNELLTLYSVAELISVLKPFQTNVAYSSKPPHIANKIRSTTTPRVQIKLGNLPSLAPSSPKATSAQVNGAKVVLAVSPLATNTQALALRLMQAAKSTTQLDQKDHSRSQTSAIDVLKFIQGKETKPLTSPSTVQTKTEMEEVLSNSHPVEAPSFISVLKALRQQS
jgi:hypothetical protein